MFLEKPGRLYSVWVCDQEKYVYFWIISKLAVTSSKFSELIFVITNGNGIPLNGETLFKSTF